MLSSFRHRYAKDVKIRITYYICENLKSDDIFLISASHFHVNIVLFLIVEVDDDIGLLLSRQ